MVATDGTNAATAPQISRILSDAATATQKAAHQLPNTISASVIAQRQRMKKPSDSVIGDVAVERAKIVRCRAKDNERY